MRWIVLVSVTFWSAGAALGADDAGLQAGFAKVVITPDEPMWMSGYGGRTAPADGKLTDLYARAAALRDAAGTTVVFVALDLIGVPASMSEAISNAVQKTHRLPRANLMFAASHTHCGPALDDRLSHMLAMDDEDWQQVRKYQQQLNGKVIDLIDAAIRDLRPARVEVGTGSCGFATNRRAPIGEGPVDHTVPVLAVYDGAEAERTLRGVIFGYACHNTTLGFQQWCGDYAGFAAQELEERLPGTTALFFTGCGADANPLPRRQVELCQMYGRMLAIAVQETLPATKPLAGPIRPAMTQVGLPFERVPSDDELTKELDSRDRFARARARYLLDEAKRDGGPLKSYPYPVQVWQFGNDLTWVALGGEVVVDYAIRLKRELPGRRVWVTGYANDVMAYIPSERVLTEGGYEGDRSMVYYQMPSKWRTGLEQKIVDTVLKLAQP